MLFHKMDKEEFSVAGHKKAATESVTACNLSWTSQHSLEYIIRYYQTVYNADNKIYTNFFSIL